MNKIAKVKNEVKLRQWAEMVRQRNESGLTVTQWCAENGVNLKTYYYRLNRVRKALCSEVEKHEIVAVEPQPEQNISSHERIELIHGDVRISLPNDFDPETLVRLLGVLR